MAVSRIDEAGLNVTQYGNRNLIINGAMQVAQRGTSETISLSVSVIGTVDRFSTKYFGSSWGNDHSQQDQVTDAPDGFLYSFKNTTLVAQDYSNALGSWYQYSFENQDIQALQNGSGVKDFTVSLWLKSNKTGNVTISVEGEYYSYSTYVSINSAATWEYKTVTFPATTLGVGIDYTGDPTGSDFNLKVGLGSDGDWLVDVDDQWNDKSTNRGVLSPQQTNFQAAVNDYLQITGVQLEVGDTATGFEHRSYGDELQRCQRYFERIDIPFQSSTTSIRSVSGNNNWNGPYICFNTTKRSAPSVSEVSGFQWRRASRPAGSVTDIGSGSYNTSTWGAAVIVPETIANDSKAMIFASSGDQLDIDAEL